MKAVIQENIHFEVLTLNQLREDLNWWMIYYSSFPSNEREEEQAILKSVTSGTGMAFCLKDRGVTKGISTVHLLKDIGVVFLVYLAIETSSQNQGYGSAFFSFIERCAYNVMVEDHKVQPKGIVCEIEKYSENLSLIQKRKMFFVKNGAIPLDVLYLQPPVDGKNTVEMQLMYKSRNEDTISVDTPQLVKSIYYQKYCKTNHISDQVIESLLLQLGMS